MESPPRPWRVEFTPEFREWWLGLDPSHKAVVGRWIELLERRGPSLGFPHSSEIRGSTIGGLRELRIQQAGRPYPVLYAFDPRRVAVLLAGGDKGSDRRWYRRTIRLAELPFARHLATIGEN